MKGFHAWYPRREKWHYHLPMVKHDSLDKAPLNDEAPSREQKLYGGSKLTSYKVYLLSCPWAQKLPGDIPVDAGLLWNKVAVDNCLLYTPPLIVFILKCNTLYMPCWHILHQAQHNPCHPQQAKGFQFCGYSNFIILSTASSRIHWGDSSWSRLKHLVSYKIPCAVNEQGMRGGHQSLANKPSYPFNFSRRMR